MSCCHNKTELDVDALIRGLFAAGPVEHDFNCCLLVELFHRSQTSLAAQPSLIDLNGPLVICGDIHGQYADLLGIFETCGWPFNTRYLFLGDYVDRGTHSLEVLVLLTALQIRFPSNVYLLRGNHESKSINIQYGFLSELRARYTNRDECDLIFQKISKVYSYLPVAALVSQTMLCLHGGLSPSLNSIKDLREMVRGQEEPSGLLEDILWADPTPGCKGFNQNDDRGCSYYFGDEAIAKQCSKLGVSIIVRGHQVVDTGVQMSNKNRVLTVFSAPSYSDDYHNRAAVLKVSRQHEVTFTYFEARKMRRVGKAVTTLRSTN